MVLTTVSLSPQSEITRSKYFGGIELIELTEASDTLNYKPVFKHCILHIVLLVFLLFVFVWNKIFCPKNWAAFHIFLIWFGNSNKKMSSKRLSPIHISDTMHFIKKQKPKVYNIRHRLQTWCFFVHESLKRDNKKEDDERKQCKITEKN